MVKLFISKRRQLSLHVNHHEIILHYLALCAGYRCACGGCKAIPTQREYICYHKIEQIKCLLEDPYLEVYPSCITQHADLTHVCLCRTVFTVFCMHIYITMKVLNYLMMKTGV